MDQSLNNIESEARYLFIFSLVNKISTIFIAVHQNNYPRNQFQFGLFVV